MKLVLYNVLSMVRAGRLQQIATTCKADVLLLTGLRWRSSGRAFDTLRLNTGHKVTWWGYSNSPFSSRASGVAVVLGRRFATSHVQAIFNPPDALQGRAGGIRVQTKAMDFI